MPGSLAWLARASGGYIFLSACRQVTATCFLPNGTIPNIQSFPNHPAEEYAPCDNTTTFSMCCRTNVPISTGKGSVYRSDGLCTLQEDQSVWRMACTDPTWQSDNCIRLCTTGRGDLWASITAPVTVCDDGSICCGNDQAPSPLASLDGQKYCQAGQGKWIVDRKLTTGKPPSSSSSIPNPINNATTEGVPPSSSLATTSFNTTSINPTTPTPNTSLAKTPLTSPTSSIEQSSSTTNVLQPTPTPNPNPLNKSNRKGIIAGIPLGTAVALASIFLVCTSLVRSRHRKNASTLPQQPSSGGTQEHSSVSSCQQQSPAEASAGLARAWRTELPSDWICEVDGSRS